MVDRDRIFPFLSLLFYKSNEKITPNLPAENSNDDRSALQAMGIGLFAVFIVRLALLGDRSSDCFGFSEQPFRCHSCSVSVYLSAGIINIAQASAENHFGEFDNRFRDRVAIPNLFRLSVDWNNHKRMIWQMTWRIPALTQHTAILGKINCITVITR